MFHKPLYTVHRFISVSIWVVYFILLGQMPELQDFGRIHTKLLSSEKGGQYEVQPTAGVFCTMRRRAFWHSGEATSQSRFIVTVINITNHFFSNECVSHLL